jgi:NADPH:quinone reductase-like Zn-dependent oxidoreductase
MAQRQTESVTPPISMKAAVYRRYGPPEVVSIGVVRTPVPGPNDLLIRVRATTVSSADWGLRSLDIPYGFGVVSRLAFGLTAPRQPILGSELAGDVVAVGRHDARRARRVLLHRR